MEHRLRLTELWSLYGALLTDKQRECLKLSLFDDFSLQEIGEELSMSRQSVCDSLRRGEKSLLMFERTLGIAAKRRRLWQAWEELSAAVPPCRQKDKLHEAINEF